MPGDDVLWRTRRTPRTVDHVGTGPAARPVPSSATPTALRPAKGRSRARSPSETSGHPQRYAVPTQGLVLLEPEGLVFHSIPAGSGFRTNRLCCPRTTGSTPPPHSRACCPRTTSGASPSRKRESWDWLEPFSYWATGHSRSDSPLSVSSAWAWRSTHRPERGRQGLSRWTRTTCAVCFRS